MRSENNDMRNKEKRIGMGTMYVVPEIEELLRVENKPSVIIDEKVYMMPIYTGGNEDEN